MALFTGESRVACTVEPQKRARATTMRHVVLAIILSVCWALLQAAESINIYAVHELDLAESGLGHQSVDWERLTDGVDGPGVLRLCCVDRASEAPNTVLPNLGTELPGSAITACPLQFSPFY